MNAKVVLLALAVVIALTIDSTLGTLAFMVALLIVVFLGARDARRQPVTTVRQMPTAYQRRQARTGRWVPGAGIGLSLWHGLRPFVFLTVHRWRR